MYSFTYNWKILGSILALYGTVPSYLTLKGYEIDHTNAYAVGYSNDCLCHFNSHKLNVIVFPASISEWWKYRCPV